MAETVVALIHDRMYDYAFLKTFDQPSTLGSYLKMMAPRHREIQRWKKRPDCKVVAALVAKEGLEMMHGMTDKPQSYFDQKRAEWIAQYGDGP